MKNLSRNQKARIITLVMIVIYLLFSTLYYVWEIYKAVPEFDYVDSMMVDGSDCAPFANLLIFGANGMLSFLTTAATVVVMIFMNVIFLVPWRLISIRKQSVVDSIEFKIARYLLIGFCACSMLGGLLLAHFTRFTYIYLLTGISAFFILIMGVRPLEKRAEKSSAIL